jgi:prepilin-type N-terminal cleavage/methylation domain-containing protein
MLNSSKYKAGVTLAEVLAVITIMGILSGLGVAGLQGAVANARVKDAAFNVTAFMERTANEARRLNSTLCVVREDAQNLGTYIGKCSDVTGAGLNGSSRIDGLVLESPNRILQSGEVTPSASLGLVNFATDGAEFTPRRGLSAAPVQGFFAVQYGGQGRYGAAAKVKDNNRFMPLMKFDNTDWSGI